MAQTVFMCECVYVYSKSLRVCFMIISGVVYSSGISTGGLWKEKLLLKRLCSSVGVFVYISV